MKTETQIKHTPGPWNVQESSRLSIVSKTRIQVWNVDNEDHTQTVAGCVGANSEANARLIATAPELYEVGKMLLEKYEEFAGVYEGFALVTAQDVAKLRQIVAKAEGR